MSSSPTEASVSKISVVEYTHNDNHKYRISAMSSDKTVYIIVMQ